MAVVLPVSLDLHHGHVQASVDAPSGPVDASTDPVGPVGWDIYHLPAQLALWALETHHRVDREGPAALDICHLVGQPALLGLENHCRFGREGRAGREICRLVGQVVLLSLETRYQVGHVDRAGQLSPGGQEIYHPAGQVENHHRTGLAGLVGLDSLGVGGPVVDQESHLLEVCVLQLQASAELALVPDCWTATLPYERRHLTAPTTTI